MYGFEFTTEEKIMKAKYALQKQAPFFAYLVLNMSTTPSENVPTIGVNARGHAVYNSEFIESLTSKELKGTLCHEVMHVALSHLVRKYDRNCLIWNIATDMVINSLLLNDGFTLPQGVLMPEAPGYTVYDLTEQDITIDVENKSAEQVYDEIFHENKENEFNASDFSFDKHSYDDSISDIEKQEIEKEWISKMAEASVVAKAAGKMPGNLERLLDKLLHPQLNWKAILYQYITKDILYNYTYKRPGKRSYSNKIYMPHEVKQNLDITVTIDNSGSITKEEYSQFIGEVMGIANAFEQINMTILHWDTRIRSETKVTRNNKNKILKMTPKGLGGTTISCIKDYYKNKQHPLLMVHLTDGFVERKPVFSNSKHLFVICKNGSKDILKNYGLTILMED